MANDKPTLPLHPPSAERRTPGDLTGHPPGQTGPALRTKPDGTVAPSGVWFGRYVWPFEVTAYLFNAVNGSVEPLPKDIYDKYKDKFAERGFGPWMAVLAFSQDYYENQLPAIEREMAESTGITVEGGAAPTGDAPYESLGVILGMGGRAARELAYQDPASFINLIATEAAGDQPSNQMLRNFLIGSAPRLYQLAGLGELIGREPEVGGPERVQSIFEQFVTPGKEGEFAGRRANVVRDLGTLAGLPSKQPGAAGQDPRDFFDPAFFLAQDTLAPTMTPTAASTLFSNERRELERALYTTALTQGKFTGSPLEWLQSRGFF